MQSRKWTCVLGLLYAGTLPAQQTSGSVEGRIIDPQGAAVEGANVTLIDQRQGSTRPQFQASMNDGVWQEFSG